MLIRLLATIDMGDARLADGRPAFGFLRFAVRDVVLADIVFPEMAGQAALRPDPDAFPVEVRPRSAATIACPRTQKLNETGKPKLTETDGL
jgi:hypothetical protein